MLSLKDFIDGLDRERPSEASDGDIVRMNMFGLDVAAVLLPSDMLSEERVGANESVLGLGWRAGGVGHRGEPSQQRAIKRPLCVRFTQVVSTGRCNTLS